MPSKTTTPPVRPASAEDVRAVHDALGILYRLVQEGAAGDDSPRVLERYHRAIAAATSLAVMARKEIGAPRGEPNEPPGRPLTPASGNPSAVHAESEGFEPPNAFASPDFESAFSPRATQLAALAWELVDRDPQLAARVAFDVLELDEHDPVACLAACCNSPLALEVRP